MKQRSVFDTHSNTILTFRDWRCTHTMGCRRRSSEDAPTSFWQMSATATLPHSRSRPTFQGLALQRLHRCRYGAGHWSTLRKASPCTRLRSSVDEPRRVNSHVDYQKFTIPFMLTQTSDFCQEDVHGCASAQGFSACRCLHVLHACSSPAVTRTKKKYIYIYVSLSSSVHDR